MVSRGGRGSNPITDCVVTSFRRENQRLWSTAGSPCLPKLQWSQPRLEPSARRQSLYLAEVAISVSRNFRSGWNRLSQRIVRGNIDGILSHQWDVGQRAFSTGATIYIHVTNDWPNYRPWTREESHWAPLGSTGLLVHQMMQPCPHPPSANRKHICESRAKALLQVAHSYMSIAAGVCEEGLGLHHRESDTLVRWLTEAVIQ